MILWLVDLDVELRLRGVWCVLEGVLLRRICKLTF